MKTENSERTRDLRDMARMCQEAKADDNLLGIAAEMSDKMRLVSACMVTSNRLTKDNELFVRQAERFFDDLTAAMLIAMDNQKKEIEEMARLLGLNEI
jgi:hypothetical protein